MEIPRWAMPPDRCDELERAIECAGTSDVLVKTVHLRGLVKDPGMLRGVIGADTPALVNPHSQLIQFLAQAAATRRWGRLLAKSRYHRNSEVRPHICRASHRLSEVVDAPAGQARLKARLTGIQKPDACSDGEPRCGE
jgi:hypothetical protein